MTLDFFSRIVLVYPLVQENTIKTNQAKRSNEVVSLCSLEDQCSKKRTLILPDGVLHQLLVKKSFFKIFLNSYK